MQTLSEPTYEQMSKSFPHWKKTGDLIDQCIDLMLNVRQSGHPGGSRSKVPLMVATTLGAMRWDIRHPELAFEEQRTASRVAERLNAWGLEVHRKCFHILREVVGSSQSACPGIAVQAIMAHREGASFVSRDTA